MGRRRCHTFVGKAAETGDLPMRSRFGPHYELEPFVGYGWFRAGMSALTGLRSARATSPVSHVPALTTALASTRSLPAPLLNVGTRISTPI